MSDPWQQQPPQINRPPQWPPPEQQQEQDWPTEPPVYATPPVVFSPYGRRPPARSGPSAEVIAVAGMGALVLLFVLWAVFRPAPSPAPAPARQPPRPLPPGTIIEWPQSPSPWAKSPAREAQPQPEPQPQPSPSVEQPARVPAAPEKVWTIAEAVEVRTTVLPDGRVVLTATNRSPRTVIDLQVGVIGDEILAFPRIAPGTAVERILDSPAVRKAVSDGVTPRATIWAGGFE